MARRTTVVLLDDLDGSPADETVEFGLDGVSFEIDLTSSHARALREQMAPYMECARRGGDRRGRNGAAARWEQRPAAAPATVDREQNKAMREWAARHGHPLPPRGRIPTAVSAAFHRGDPDALPGTKGQPDTAPADPESGSSGSATVAVQAAAADSPPAESAASSSEGVGPDQLRAEERERIRAWAVEEGIEVKARGRLSKDLIANYRAVQARR